MPQVRFQLRRLCKRCDKMFFRNGAYQKICDRCLVKAYKNRGKNMKASYVKKNTTKKRLNETFKYPKH